MSETDLDTQPAAPAKEAETKAQTPWESMDPDGEDHVKEAGEPASPAVQLSLPAQGIAPAPAQEKKASPFASTAIVAVGAEMQQLAAELQSLMAENRFNPFEAMIASPLEKAGDHLLGKAFLSDDKIEVFEESFAGAAVSNEAAESVEPPAAPLAPAALVAPADPVEKKQDEPPPARPAKSRKKSRRPKTSIASLKQAAISAVNSVVSRLTHDGPVYTGSTSRIEPEEVRSADPTMASGATEVHVGSALRTETPEIAVDSDATTTGGAIVVHEEVDQNLHVGQDIGSSAKIAAVDTTISATTSAIDAERVALENTPWATIDETPAESILTTSVETPISEKIPLHIEPLQSLVDVVTPSPALPAIDETAMADFSALPTPAVTFDGESALTASDETTAEFDPLPPIADEVVTVIDQPAVEEPANVHDTDLPAPTVASAGESAIDPSETGVAIDDEVVANQESALTASDVTTADFDPLPPITDEVETVATQAGVEEPAQVHDAVLPAPTVTFAAISPIDSATVEIEGERAVPVTEVVTAVWHPQEPLDVDDPPFVSDEVDPGVAPPVVEQPIESAVDAPSTLTATFTGTSEPIESSVTFSTTAPEVFEVTPSAGFVTSVENDAVENPLDQPLLVHDDEAEYVATVEDAALQPQVDAETEIDAETQVEVEAAAAPVQTSTGAGWTIPVMCLGLGLIACCLTIPQLDLNRRLRYEQANLQTSLATVEKQVAVNDEFLKKVMDDPTLAERLASRQKLTIRKGQRVVPLKQISDESEMSPFALVAVAPPPAPAPYAPIRGTIADICNNAHARLYLLGSAMVMVAVGLVIGCGPRGKEGFAE